MLNSDKQSVIFKPGALVSVYEQAFQSIGGKNILIPEIEIEFYPYVNINSRIKSADGTVSVRIAELLRDAPAAVHRALAEILVAKLLDKKIPRKSGRIYREYLADENFQARAIEHKRRTGRKILSSPKGVFFDLEEIFIKLNALYFRNEMPQPKLSWSQRKTFHRLGHYDQIHEAVVVSKSLDAEIVPEFVVEYVVYHELLHIKHPVVRENGKRRIHTPAFKRDEEKFRFFREAEDWINENARNLKRFARRKS